MPAAIPGPPVPGPVVPGSTAGSIPKPAGPMGPPVPAQNNVMAGLPGGLSIPASGPTANPYQGGNATALGGYNNAISTLKDALQNTQGIYSGQEAAAGQQLKQNQGNVQQNLVNKGLGNTTVSQTMQQAPLQTYNQSMLNIANAQAQAQNSQLDQLAQTYSGGGQALGGLSNQTNANYAQSQNAANGQQNQAAMLGSQLSNQNSNMANGSQYSFDPNFGNDLLQAGGGSGYGSYASQGSGNLTQDQSPISNVAPYGQTMASLWSSLGGNTQGGVGGA